MTTKGRPPILPSRLRAADLRGGFAFVPNRFLHQGHFEALDHLERSVYFLLLLAGDRSGLSFYSNSLIRSILRIDSDELIGARESLRRRDLIAYDGGAFQVLSLPSSPAARRVVPPFGDRP